MSCMHIMLVAPARRRIGLDSTGRGVAPARPVNRVLIGLIELFALWKTNQSIFARTHRASSLCFTLVRDVKL